MSQSTEAIAMNPAPDEAEEDFEVAMIEEPEAAAGPMIALDDPAQQKRLLEALLFASPEPISIRTMQNRLPDSADVGGILMQLKEEYAERGVNLVQMEDVWAFRTAVDLGAHLALNKKEEKKLSRAALETLSIIAYHQPVTRAEVENIRGVATSKGTLDVLMEAGWIKPGRRLETPGRPLTWITTNTFLDEFGISDLKDLPGLQELKATGLLDTRPAIETIPGAADLFGANENTPAVGADDDAAITADDEADDDAYDEEPADAALADESDEAQEAAAEAEESSDAEDNSDADDTEYDEEESDEEESGESEDDEYDEDDDDEDDDDDESDDDEDEEDDK